MQRGRRCRPATLTLVSVGEVGATPTPNPTATLLRLMHTCHHKLLVWCRCAFGSQQPGCAQLHPDVHCHAHCHAHWRCVLACVRTASSLNHHTLLELDTHCCTTTTSCFSLYDDSPSPSTPTAAA